MQFSQYERYRGMLAGILIDLVKNRQARQALRTSSGTSDPAVPQERMRLYNQNLELHRERSALLRTAELILEPGELDIINTEAEILAEEWVEDPSAVSSITRGIVYRTERTGNLQHFRKTPDDRIEWELEARYPRRTIAKGIADTMGEAQRAMKDAIARELRDHPESSTDEPTS